MVRSAYGIGRLSLSTIPEGSITLQILGGGVPVGVVVIVVDIVRETETELLGLLEIDRVKEGLAEDEAGTPIVPAKL
jgi:hypothetical protein